MIYFLAFIFITSTEFFGFIHQIELIKIPGVGVLNLEHVLIIIAYLFSIFQWKQNRINLKDPVIFPIFILLAAIFLQAFINMIIDGVDFSIIVQDLKSLYVIFLFIPFIMLIKSNYQLHKFIKILLFLGFINSLVLIFQFVTGTTLSCSSIRHIAFGFYRVYHPNALFICVCLIISISALLTSSKTYNKYSLILYIPFYVVSILATFHRSLIISCILCLLIIIFINFLLSNRLSFLSLSKYLILIIILFFIGIYFFNYIGIGLDPLGERILSSYDNLSNIQGTTTENRIYKLLYQINGVKEHTLFGVGFLYNPDLVQGYSDPLAISSDIAFGNIIIFLGFIGILIFALIYFNMFRFSIRFYKITSSRADKQIALALIPIPILFIILSFFGSLLFSPPRLTLLMIFVGVLYLLRVFNYEKTLTTIVSSS